ncbi:MAG TPA: hypothetical protein VG992_03280 [Candidatus Saccharimonadales bacterium]|nr:hypothetical protein [Candidatus Saccharimonadales bacterium]
MRGPVNYLSKKFWGESLQETVENGTPGRRGARYSAAIFAVWACTAGAMTSVIVKDVVQAQVEAASDGPGYEVLDQAALLPMEAGAALTGWATLELAGLAVRSWRREEDELNLPDVPQTAEE